MSPLEDAAQILFGKPVDQFDETKRDVLFQTREGVSDNPIQLSIGKLYKNQSIGEIKILGAR